MYTTMYEDDTVRTIIDAPYRCPDCGSDEIDKHHTHAECARCGWKAAYERIVSTGDDQNGD